MSERLVVALCLVLCWSCSREADLAQIQREASHWLSESKAGADQLWLLPPDSLSVRLNQLEMYEAELQNIDTSRLKSAQLKEWKLTNSTLKSVLNKLRAHRDDPSAYNLGAHLKLLLVNDTLSQELRWQRIGVLLEQAPAYYQNAQRNLQHPSPQRLRLAVQKQMLTLRLLNGELRDSLHTATLTPGQRQNISTLIPAAQSAIKDYIVFCNNVYFR